MTDRFGRNMSQADADRVAWIVLSLIYLVLVLPAAALLVWFGLADLPPTFADVSRSEQARSVVYGLALTLTPLANARRIHRHISPRRARP